MTPFELGRTLVHTQYKFNELCAFEKSPKYARYSNLQRELHADALQSVALQLRILRWELDSLILGS